MILPVRRQNVSHRAQRLRKIAIGASVLTLVALPAQARDGTFDAYHERNFILAAQARCGLFGDPVELALEAAALQTRGVLLRAGHDANSLTTVANRAAGQARATACNDPALQETSQRIVHAFSRWQRAARLDFPSKQLSWRVDRFAGSSAGWRMVQDTSLGTAKVRFGLVGHDPEVTAPTVVVSFKGRSRPYAARLVMRDPSLLPRLHGLNHGQALMPPVSSRKIIFAASHEAAPKNLLAEGAHQGEVWTFPQDAMDQVVGLDPREPFWVEFLFRDDSIARVAFEAGDAGAAKRFLALGAV